VLIRAKMIMMMNKVKMRYLDFLIRRVILIIKLADLMLNSEKTTILHKI